MTPAFFRATHPSLPPKSPTKRISELRVCVGSYSEGLSEWSQSLTKLGAGSDYSKCADLV